ncbi:MAG: glycosyltransferase family 4 protein [Armatimonadota bacterium]
MRTVLMVAYHYPPDNAVGALRTQRFVRYLPEFGWSAVVLTVRRGGANGEHGIIRSRMLPGVRQAVRWVKGLMPGRSRQVDARESEWAAGYAAPDAASISGLRRALYALMWLPDDRHGWLIPATVAGVQGVLRHRPRVIYTSGPPWTCHLVGLAVAVLTGRPLVADFRDPWVGAPGKPAFVRTSWSDRADLAMERMVISRASAVVCSTWRLQQEMTARHPGVPESRFVVVPNGFDPEELTRVDWPVSRHRNEVVLAYAGTLYGARDPRPLFGAASAVRGSGAPPFRLVFMGDCDRAAGMPLDEMVTRYGLSDCVELTGVLPRQECMRKLGEADILLLFAMGQPAQVPAKLYEYIGLGKPVLALAEPESETARLVVETRAGVAVNAADGSAVRAAFELAVGGRLSGSPPEVRCRYDGRSLTGRLAEVLNEVSRARSCRHA